MFARICVPPCKFLIQTRGKKERVMYHQMYFAMASNTWGTEQNQDSAPSQSALPSAPKHPPDKCCGYIHMSWEKTNPCWMYSKVISFPFDNKKPFCLFRSLKCKSKAWLQGCAMVRENRNCYLQLRRGRLTNNLKEIHMTRGMRSVVKQKCYLKLRIFEKLWFSLSKMFDILVWTFN